MKKILLIISSIFISLEAFANQPKDWQLGFQNPASDSMRDIVSFHNNLLLPIIIAISVFVLFLMLSMFFLIVFSHLKANYVIGRDGPCHGGIPLSLPSSTSTSAVAFIVHMFHIYLEPFVYNFAILYCSSP